MNYNYNKEKSHSITQLRLITAGGFLTHRRHLGTTIRFCYILKSVLLQFLFQKH